MLGWKCFVFAPMECIFHVVKFYLSLSRRLFFPENINKSNMENVECCKCDKTKLVKKIEHVKCIRSYVEGFSVFGCQTTLPFYKHENKWQPAIDVTPVKPKSHETAMNAMIMIIILCMWRAFTLPQTHIHTIHNPQFSHTLHVSPRAKPEEKSIFQHFRTCANNKNNSSDSSAQKHHRITSHTHRTRSLHSLMCVCVCVADIKIEIK